VVSNGFPPIADAHARVLILGSLPGQVSLRQQQYYAQPRNAFWAIMGRLFDAGPDVPYDERTRRLVKNQVALWDVCAAAHRPGSLDAAIRPASVVPNDFAAFIAAHPQIRLIAFNGAKAAELFRRIVLPGLPDALQALRYETLPSTSPAHASMTLEDKLARWSIIQNGMEA
jgi:double-stranded uracil-DNA glycosylase